VPITTKVVSSNLAHGIHFVIKFLSDLLQVGGFLWVLWFPPPIKTYCHDITEKSGVNHHNVNQLRFMKNAIIAVKNVTVGSETERETVYSL